MGKLNVEHRIIQDDALEVCNKLPDDIFQPHHLTSPP